MSAQDPQPGDIFASRHDPHHRCIIYQRPKDGGVFYAEFPSLGWGGGGYCGPGAPLRFLEAWRYEATMGFGGAFKQIRRLQRENQALQRQLEAALVHAVANRQAFEDAVRDAA